MTARPILFSAPMVRALLDGSKTQTRRVVKDSEHVLYWRRGEQDPRRWVGCDGLPIGHVYCPYGDPGDRLWVRETAWINGGYVATDPEPHANAGKRPPIFMRRVESRIALEITEVRLERLQSISPADAIAEGIRPTANSQTIDCDTPNPCHAYRSLWESINGDGSWASNPWVWALTFRRLP